MPTLLNAVNCKKYELGTGLVDCEPFFQEPKAFIITPMSWSMPVTETFDLDYVVSKIQDGTFVPFLNAVQFTENTAEPTRQDYTGGNRRTNRNGNPDYTFEYDNGTGFHAAAYSYNGYKGRVIIIDQAGTVQLQRNAASTVITGFYADDIWTRTYRQQAGDTRPATMIDVHLGNTEEFNRQMTLISSDTIGSNLNSDIYGVISVSIGIVTASVGNGLTVDVKSVNNTTFGVQGLDLNVFEIYNVTTNTVSTPIQAIESTTVAGRYKLADGLATAGQNIIVRTKSFALGYAGKPDDSNLLYRGQSTATVVTA